MARGKPFVEDVSGTEAVTRDYNIHPYFQRKTPPKNGLRNAMSSSARLGLLHVVVLVWRNMIGDGRKRVTILQEWAKDPQTAKLLESTVVTFVHFDHLSQAQFIDEYIDRNMFLERMGAGEYLRGKSADFPKEVTLFMDDERFNEGEPWYKLGLRFLGLNLLMCDLLDAPLNSRGEYLIKTLKTREIPLEKIGSSIGRITGMYSIVLTIESGRKPGEVSPTSKSNQAVVFTALKEQPKLLELNGSQLLGGWNKYSNVVKNSPILVSNREVGDKRKALLLLEQYGPFLSDAQAQL